MSYGSIVAASEGNLVLALMRREPVPHRASLNLERLLRLIGGHGLIGILDDIMQGPRNGGVEPLPELRGRLRTMAQAQEGWVRSQLEAAREAGIAFAAAGVPYAFVKGVALLAAGIYSRPSLRSFGDIDVLIEEPGLEHVTSALASIGFEREPTQPNPMQVHYYRRRAGVGVEIDLHWAFMSDDSLLAPICVPIGEIVGRSRMSGGVRVPADEDSLLLAAAHFIRSCAPTMILVVDFERLAWRIADWPTVVSRASTWGLRTCAWVGLRLAVDFCRAVVPVDVMEQLAPPPWRQQAILGLLSRRRFWGLARSRDIRYRFLLKLLCLDHVGHVIRACTLAPLGALRRLGLLGVTRR